MALGMFESSSRWTRRGRKRLSGAVCRALVGRSDGLRQ